MTKLQIPNLHQTVVNTFLSGNISNSINRNKFLVGIFNKGQSHISQVNETAVSECVNQLVAMIRLQSQAARSNALTQLISSHGSIMNTTWTSLANYLDSTWPNRGRGAFWVLSFESHRVLPDITGKYPTLQVNPIFQVIQNFGCTRTPPPPPALTLRLL